MGRLTTSFILGFHGCEEDLAKAVIAGSADLNPSGTDIDWLGKGVYFWEADVKRAQEWAEWRVSRGDYVCPEVVGAVIDLGNCLDLTTREDLELLKFTYDEYVKKQEKADLKLAENKNSETDQNEDRLLRYLDCAVINHLHFIMKDEKKRPFDTVRGMFAEGGDLYTGAGFQEKTHTQIAVINPECIKGFFIPR